jgi:hypothetical protein
MDLINHVLTLCDTDGLSPYEALAKASIVKVCRMQKAFNIAFILVVYLATAANCKR